MRPWCLALMGLPGAGKTTTALMLERSVKADIISRDAIRDAMFPSCTYTIDEKRAAFDGVLRAVGTTVRLGRSAIVDGIAFSTVGDLEEVTSTVEGAGGDLLAVYLDCPVDLAVARVVDDRQNGRHTASDRDEELVRRVACSFRELPQSVHVVDATAKPSDVAAQVCRLLGLAAGDGVDHQ